MHVILEIIIFADKNFREFNPTMQAIADKGFHNNKSSIIENAQNGYRDLVKNTIG